MPNKKSRLQQLRQRQKQSMVVNIHLADKVKRRRRMKRGGVNRSKPLPPAPLQVATPRRMVQQTIHLPAEAITPQTPFRSQNASHPQYIKTTEHKKKEMELYVRELQKGIDQRIAQIVQNYEDTVVEPTTKRGVKVEFGEPQKPNPLPQVKKEPDSSPQPKDPFLLSPLNPLITRRTTQEVNEAIRMGKEDPNPFYAKKTLSIERVRNERKLISPSRYDSPVNSPPSISSKIVSGAFPNLGL